jgi:hypothetical protein
MVVEAIAKHSVDGAVYAPSGPTWRLTCPAANALEHSGPSAARDFGKAAKIGTQPASAFEQDSYRYCSREGQYHTDRAREHAGVFS